METAVYRNAPTYRPDLSKWKESYMILVLSTKQEAMEYLL